MHSVVGIEGEVSRTVRLDKVVQFCCTVILNGHCRQGSLDICISGFRRFKSRQGTSYSNYGGSSFFGHSNDRGSCSEGIFLRSSKKLQCLCLFAQSLGLVYRFCRSLQVGGYRDDGTDHWTTGSLLRPGRIEIIDSGEGEGNFRKSGQVLQGIRLLLGRLHEILNDMRRRKEMRFVSRNNTAGLLPEFGSKDFVLFRSEVSLQLLLIHRWRAGRKLSQVCLHVGAELVLVLFHSQKLHFRGIYGSRHGVGILFRVRQQVCLEILQTLLGIIAGKSFVSSGN
mmetsp:Transcript_16942/g.27498  ORF Transcript_16942/g.27498 Transcript_16942/m.27498 type:complete len:281 (+) Transcript_16942:430-1272(+)